MAGLRSLAWVAAGLFLASVAASPARGQGGADDYKNFRQSKAPSAAPTPPPPVETPAPAPAPAPPPPKAGEAKPKKKKKKAPKASEPSPSAASDAPAKAPATPVAAALPKPAAVPAALPKPAPAPDAPKATDAPLPAQGVAGQDAAARPGAPADAAGGKAAEPAAASNQAAAPAADGGKIAPPAADGGKTASPAADGGKTAPPTAEADKGDDAFDPSAHLTGDWGGKRTALYALGVDLELVYKGETDQGQGVRKGHAYLDNIDAKLLIDAEKLLGWTGGHLFLYGLSDHGGHPGEYMGTLQTTSNIEVPADSMKLYEAWAQQDFAGGAVSVLVGLHDLNSEFYETDSAGDYLNASFGVGAELAQTGRSGPSIFPVTAPAVRVRAQPTKTFYTQVALFNGVAGDPTEPHHVLQGRRAAGDGFLAVTEIGLMPTAEVKDAPPRKYALGAWTYTRPVSRVDADEAAADPQQGVSSGAYALVDQDLFGPVSLFGHYGVASSAVNRLAASAAAGLTATGLLPLRDRDVLGVGWAQVWNGREVRAASAARGEEILPSERVYEVFYRLNIGYGLALTPDYQYVLHPGTVPGAPPAREGLLRLEVAL